MRDRFDTMAGGSPASFRGQTVFPPLLFSFLSLPFRPAPADRSAAPLHAPPRRLLRLHTRFHAGWKINSYFDSLAFFSCPVLCVLHNVAWPQSLPGHELTPSWPTTFCQISACESKDGSSVPVSRAPPACPDVSRP